MRNLIFVFFIASLALQAQVEIKKSKPLYPEKSVKTPCDFGVVESLREIKEKARPMFRKNKIVKNKLRRYKYINANAKPTKEDPVIQVGHKRSLALTPIKSWQGIDQSSQGATPPDPSGAVGINHYVQMVNCAMQVFDKNGNSLWGPTSLSSVFPGSSDDGDPIVMYDQFADRWFISQFQTSSNKVLIAISKTSDPLGEWYYYEYQFDDFPDYPKFSIWGDGYYMTANMSVQNAVCFERTKMLAGDASARMVALTFPNLQTNGFFSALPAHASGDDLPSTPINFFYFQDDGWAQGSDRIKIWEMTVDWNNTSNSKIELKQELNVAPFDAEFDENWDDITQPGVSEKLDGVPGAFMYMAHYRSFGDYNALTLCHSVDVDQSSSIKSAVRWYELHEESGTWKINQQSTYAPDSDNRWMGSIALDKQGNIGLAYSVSSSTTYPGIRFTGRKKDDNLSQMTISESNAFDGSGVQTNTNRFGDYSQMTVDPTDGITFWYTGEFIGSSGWETGIFSFKIGTENDYDVSLVKVVSPESGHLTGAEAVKILIKNIGKNPLSNFNLSYFFEGNTVTEIFSNTLQPGDTASFTFASTVDLSVSGEYNLTVFSGHSGDGDRSNDTLLSVIEIPYQKDAGVTQIKSPSSDVGLKDETVTISVKNYGIQKLQDIPLVLVVDGAIHRDTLTDEIESGEIKDFSFGNKIDFSTVKTYQLMAYTNLSGDQKHSNDTAKKSVETYNCNPTSDCEEDYISSLKIEDINNYSACSANGYGDYTSQSTDLEQGESYELKVTCAYNAHALSAWIDYNDDKVFQDSELILKNENYDWSAEFTVDIPNDAEVGEHLMRVRTAWREDSDDPCAAIDYGETEDYTVKIVTSNSTEELNGFEFEVLNESNSIRVISSQTLNEDFSLELLNGNGQIVYTKQFLAGNQLDDLIAVSNFASGIYYVKVSNEEKSSVKQFMVR